MSMVGWIVVGLMVWMAVAAVVAVLIGRAIRMRDRQVPRPPPMDSAGASESRESRPERRDRA